MNHITVARYDSSILPYPLRVDGELESLQKLVGGYIEAVHLPNGLVLVCNEEGTLQSLPVHHAVNLRGVIPIAGDFFVCRTRDGEFASITGEDFAKLAGIVFPVRVR